MADHWLFRNTHLEGKAFFWEGGPVGVLLSHGFTATTAEVRLLARFLHEHGYTVAGPLLPGHGTSPHALNRCVWQDWASALEAAYQDIASRCEQVFVGGESMGGVLALQLALAHPELAGVMAYAPALKVPSPILPLLAPLVAPFVPLLSKGKPRPSAAEARWQGYPVVPVQAAAQLFALQREVWPRLEEITQPLLVVQGRLDDSVDLGATAALYERANSEVKALHWMEDSTHCVLLDHEWEDVAALTLEFMQNVES